MLLNLIVAIIVGCLLLALYAIKILFDVIKSMDRSIKNIAKVGNLLNDRLSRLEIISVVDQKKAKKNNSWKDRSFLTAPPVQGE